MAFTKMGVKLITSAASYNRTPHGSTSPSFFENGKQVFLRFNNVLLLQLLLLQRKYEPVKIISRKILNYLCSICQPVKIDD